MAAEFSARAAAAAGADAAAGHRVDGGRYAARAAACSSATPVQSSRQRALAACARPLRGANLLMKGYLRHLRCQTRAREALGRASRPAWRRGDIASAWPTQTPDDLPRLSPFQGCMRLCARRAADAARSVALNGGRVILEGVAMRASSCPERLQPTRCGRIYPEVRQCAAVARPGLDVFPAPGAYFRAVCQIYRTALAS